MHTRLVALPETSPDKFTAEIDADKSEALPKVITPTDPPPALLIPIAPVTVNPVGGTLACTGNVTKHRALLEVKTIPVYEYSVTATTGRYR